MDGKRILVVDDEPSIRDLVGDALAAQGFRVESAGTAEEALSKVRDHLFDAAILDFALPDMNGVQLHRAIRQMDEELSKKTLFISGLPQSDNDLSYYEDAASGFLPKPFEIMHLLAEVRRLVGR